MALVGTLTYLGESYVYLESNFTKGSRQLLLLSTQNSEQSENSIYRRDSNYYSGGGVIDYTYLIGILDPVRKKQYGSIQVLNLVYDKINEIISNSKMARTYEHSQGTDYYKFENSTIAMQGSKLYSISIRSDEFRLEARWEDKITGIKPRATGKLLVDMPLSASKYNTATFKDASLESLEREGYDMTWMEPKKYIPIHSVADWDNLVIPRLIEEFERWKREKYFKVFLMSIDYESTGIKAFCELHPDRDKAVYFSISFADNESFGVFLDMENFDNADIDGIAERLTYITQMDVLEDRDITLFQGPKVLSFKRSELCVTGHNFMIDRRFGFTVNADVWFDLCTLQLSFNLDPFATKGRNGLKHIVTKLLGIEYAELGDICGPKNKGMFRYLSDKRVVMMYGCADTDLHRMVARKMIEIAENAKEYYNGVDHFEQHLRLDRIYMNHKADCDYQGMRVDYEGFKKEYEEKSRILNLYYSFMSQYAGRVKAYNDYEQLVVNAERFNIDLERISGKDIDRAPAVNVNKWSGKELLEVLFRTLNYPILAWTEQNKKAKLAGKAFKPKPAVNTDALKVYMEHEATVSIERIEEAMKSQKSLEDLKWYAMYLKEDFIDPQTGTVLISKKEFNSLKLPFTMVLRKISPIIKSITAELKPIVESNSEYKFSVCNMTSAVTRRDLNPTQTVSGTAKHKYKAYTDDYYYGAVDQSAVEIRILYGLSGDENLILPLNDPEKDSHTETAAMMHQRPAHTIDKKTRKGIKEVGFGIPYGKGIWSLAMSLLGDTTPDSIAEATILYNLYEEKLAPVMKVLNGVRDKMDDPVNMPEDLFAFLELDPEKEYGRMINEFGFCQHLEIRRGVEWFRQALRRKAGNFIIQGFAANLLRIIYLRMLKAFWAKGWIQNRKVRVHLTVHDEVDFSYHKSLNPVEVMSILHETLTVRIKGFPTFYVGINFGHSWGQAKDDASELPVNLVRELDKRFKDGEFDNKEFGDHIQFFDGEREAYFVRRVTKELNEVNERRNVWSLEFMNDKFTNYTVRSLLPSIFEDPLLHINKNKEEDQIKLLASFLPKFIAKHILPNDNRKHHLVYGNKAVEITEAMLEQQFETLEDLFNNKPIAITESKTLEPLEVDDFSMSLDLDDDEDFGYDFGEIELDDQEEYATDGIEELNTGFLNVYNTYKKVEEEYVEYGSTEARVLAESSKNVEKFENFSIVNKKVIVHVYNAKMITEINKKCVGNTSNHPSAISLYVKHGMKLKSMNAYSVEFLHVLDEYITALRKGKVGV